MSDASATATKGSLLAWFETVPGKALKMVLTADALLLVLYLVGLALATHVHGLFFLLDLKSEGNPPTWWYGTQQFLVGMTFLLLASKLFASDAFVKPVRNLFLVAGIGFVFISADEVGEIHESVSRLVSGSKTIHNIQVAVLKAIHISHDLHGGGIWLFAYLIVGIALIWWSVPYLKKAYQLWRKQLMTVVLGFGIFVFSAAILQVVGYFQPAGSNGFHVYVFVEQMLKMVGMSIVFYGAMQVLTVSAGRLTRRLAGEEAPEV